MLGIRGTKSSPPCMTSNESTTNLTAASRVIQKRVIRLSVTGRLLPSALSLRKNGTTEPRLPITLP